MVADPVLQSSQPQPAMLQVERSLMQARWVLSRADQDHIEQLVRRHGLSEVIARLLAARAVAPDQVEAFLNPRLARDFPDPLSLAGMADAAAFLADAIKQSKRIAVFGDFDVDGATSTAVLVRFLRHCGLDVPFYIPDRKVEGYGPNIKALRQLKDQGADIVILADCGITAFDVIEHASDIGLDIVVIDHHEAEDRLPPARHVINPKRKDDTSGLTMLAACGVAFMTCVAVNARLREDGFFKDGRTPAPLKDWLDIVALGTVCDMVPLTGVNRLFVRAGFSLMAKHNNPGIKALCQQAGIKDDPTTYHAGFVLGPRINAGSRVHQANLGARLLCTDDAEEARNIAFTLEDCNDKRKAIQQEMFDQAVAMVEAKALHEHPVIIVGHEAWQQPGMSGLVAGRLKEKYNKPAIVVTYMPGHDGALEGRGSGRSVKGINMGGAFIEARHRGLLSKGGGHAMAAGFTVAPGQFDGFSAFLRDNIGRQMEGVTPQTNIAIDSVITAQGAQVELARLIIDNIGPFGADQPEPVFVLANMRIHTADVIGTDHVRCMIGDWEGGARLKAIAFRAAGTPLGDALLKQSAASMPLHLAGSLKINRWNDKDSVELHILDAAHTLSLAPSLG